MHTRGSKLHGKTRLQNCQILENLLGNIKIFPRLKSNFPPPKSNFFKGFPFPSMAFCFPQRLSDFPQWLSVFLNGFLIFLNGFPLSKKSKKIYLRRQVYIRLLLELRISCHLLPKLHNSRYNVYISSTVLKQQQASN